MAIKEGWLEHAQKRAQMLTADAWTQGGN
jgi:hypothetical protein